MIMGSRSRLKPSILKKAAAIGANTPTVIAEVSIRSSDEANSFTCSLWIVMGEAAGMARSLAQRFLHPLRRERAVAQPHADELRDRVGNPRRDQRGRHL